MKNLTMDINTSISNLTTTTIPSTSENIHPNPLSTSSKNYRGVCGILTHYYVENNQIIDITMFVVREGSSMGSAAGYYTAPMGMLDEKSISSGVAREVKEELHISLASSQYRNANKFLLTPVPFPGRDGGMRHNAVFISKEPLDDYKHFNEEEYDKLHLYYQLQYTNQEKQNYSTSSIEPYLETDGMTQIPLRNILAAVPLNNRGDPHLYPDQFLPLHSGQIPDYSVQDIHNEKILLRPIFSNILGHPLIRKELQRQLDQFDQTYRINNNNNVSNLASSYPLVGNKLLPKYPPNHAITHSKIPHQSIIDLHKNNYTEEDLLTFLPLPSQEPKASIHLISEVYLNALVPPFRLYVGDIHAAMSYETLSLHGITHVINCCVADLDPDDKVSWAPFSDHGIQYGIVNTNDGNKPGPKENPSQQWPAVMALLREAMHYPGGGAALIHCYMGKNRSVTTAAVFMALHGFALTFDDAVEQIKLVRPIAGPLPIYLEFGRTFVNKARNLPPYKALSKTKVSVNPSTIKKPLENNDMDITLDIPKEKDNTTNPSIMNISIHNSTINEITINKTIESTKKPTTLLARRMKDEFSDDEE